VLAFAFGGPTGLAGAHAAPSTSTIVKVLVFPDRALVTRQIPVACATGVRIELDGLPPSADGASFRAYTDRGTIDGLRTESRARIDAFAPKVRELMERHGLKYVSGPLLTQAAAVYVKVVELSLPNKVPGRRRRDMIRLAAKKAWRTRSLGRFS
jgi:hypothetical protein